ncbi:hypothetical protein V7056_19415 [Bacillus sp. JJ664]
MKDLRYITINSLLLLAIIPLSLVGYYFAVYNESLFFIYEWLLSITVVTVFILAIIGIVKIQSKLKWISISIFAFMIQFSVLSLFLGPFTKYPLFILYYFIAAIAFVLFILAIRNVDKLKFIPIIFTVLSVIFTLYMMLLNNLWGMDLS